MEVEPKELIRFAIALRPAACDGETIRSILGDAATDSLTRIAEAFGVSPATVRSWRQSGMPGDSKLRRYVWADVLIWWLRREAKRNGCGKSNDNDERQRRELERIELAMAQANLRFRQARAERLSNEFVNRRLAQSELATVFSILRESVMGLADMVKPQVPADVADKVWADIDRTCRRVLETTANRLKRITAEENEPKGVSKNGRPDNH